MSLQMKKIFRRGLTLALLLLALLLTIATPALAKTESSSPVENVFFYVTDTEGKAQLAAVLPMADLQQQAQSSDPAYFSYTDAGSFICYGEGRGLTLPQLVSYAAQTAGQSLSFSGADELSFKATDGGSRNFSYTQLYGEDRFYYPELYTSDDPDEIAASAQAAQTLLLTEGHSGRIISGGGDFYDSGAEAYIAENGVLTGYFADSYSSVDTPSLALPITAAELAEGTATAYNNFKWIYQIQLTMAADQPAPGGTVDAVTADFSYDPDSHEMTVGLSCDTPDAVIYHSYSGSSWESTPQYLYSESFVIADYNGEALTLRARAVRPGYSDSGDQTLSYSAPHQLTLATMTNGSLSVDKTSASQGESVTVSVEPEAGYMLAPDSLTYSYTDSLGSHTQPLTASDNGYSFSMPAADVTLDADFIPAIELSFELEAAAGELYCLDQLQLSLSLVGDGEFSLYSGQYCLSFPSSAFSVSEVEPASGWDWGQAQADGMTYLTFVYLDIDGSATDNAHAVADISLSLRAEGERQLTPFNAVCGDVAGQPLSVSVGDGLDLNVAAEPPINTRWYDASQTDFVLESAAQLRGLAAIVNGTATDADGQPLQDDFSGKSIALAADIVLAADDLYSVSPVYFADGAAEYSGTFNVPTLSADATLWLPIGGPEQPFLGSFDGDEHTVSGLYTNDTTAAYQGLFGYLGAGAAVCDLTVSGALLGQSYVGGIAGFAQGASLSDLTNRALIYASGGATAPGSGISQLGHAGGIIGGGVGAADDPLTLQGCANYGSVTVPNCKKGGRVGGIVGCIDSGAGSISQCSNYGAVTAYQYVGGIIGGAFSSQLEIEQCANRGAISGSSSGKVYLGGIAGKSCSSISDCYNTGALTSAALSGQVPTRCAGIVGQTEGCSISNCYNAGALTINHSSGSVGTSGSIVGDAASAPINCYYLDSNGWGNWQGSALNATGLSAAATSLSVYFAADSNAINNGYPVLAWENGAQAEAPSYAVSLDYDDQQATVTLSAATAKAGETVSVYVNDLATDWQVAAILLNNGGTVSTVASNSEYSFVMPAQSVTLSLLFEDGALSGQRYALNIDAALDPIWTISPSALDLSDGAVKAGAVVTVTVTRAEDAHSASLSGLTLTDADAQNLTYTTVSTTQGAHDTVKGGVYTFTMPAADVNLSLSADYAPLEIYSQAGETGAPQLERSLSRSQMQDLVDCQDVYYTGYDSYPTAVIGWVQQGVSLAVLLEEAGLSLDPGDRLLVQAVDGYVEGFTYAELLGVERYYYPQLYSGTTAEEKAANKQALAPMLAISGYQERFSELPAGESISDQPADTLNAYRFVFGQSETNFNNGEPASSSDVKTVGRMGKLVSSLTVIETQSAVMLGDVNGDGNINAKDAVLISQHRDETKLLSGSAFTAGDVNADAVINAKDAVLLRQYRAGIITAFPGE